MVRRRQAALFGMDEKEKGIQVKKMCIMTSKCFNVLLKKLKEIILSISTAVQNVATPFIII
jgi:hypothetical protein